MKIGILTLPFNSNYGGILQAYALQTSLERLGHDVVVLEHEVSTPKRLKVKIRYLVYLKRFILKFLFGKNIIVKEDKLNREKYLNNLSEINRFIASYIKLVGFDVNNPYKFQLDAIVVGSDQVWRPCYANPIYKYFLDFISEDKSIRKIAYAASFGTDKWEFTSEETDRCSELVKNFDCITVREDSGVGLCEKYFGVQATHVLDPTMLLDKEDYIKIVETAKVPKFRGNLFAYILDENPEKNNYVSLVSNKLGLLKYGISSIDNYKEQDIPFPSVLVWLRAFMDAEFVVTDSFHGCVFSIIFNKPFIAIGNECRGMSRFNSLLKLFQLENRLIYSLKLSNEPIVNDIDWKKVNQIKEEMKDRSMSIIISNL